MLYGPAGTGKTIMCQAAAYEAKAELIIGIITIIAICAKLYIRLFHIYFVITHLSSHYVILFSFIVPENILTLASSLIVSGSTTFSYNACFAS